MRDLLGGLLRSVVGKALAYAFAGGAVLALIGCAWVIVWIGQIVETKVDVVNATGVPLRIAVDGEPARTVQDGEWILLQPVPGTHRVVATGPAGVVEVRALEIGIGDALVWNVGGAARFAVISRDKTPEGRDVPRVESVRRYDPPDHLFAFPDDVTLEMVDLQFRIGYGSQLGEIGDETTRLCTLWDGDRRLGCELCQEWDRCAPFVLPAPAR